MLINMVLPGAVETARLPKEYQEVEYIQSSGTQYIDTGFVSNQDTRLVADFQITATPTSTLGIFGTRKTAGSTKGAFAIWNVSKAVRFDYNETPTSTGIATAGYHVVDINKNIANIDGTSFTATYASFNSTYPIFLFAVNNGGTADSRMVSASWYSCQIYDNGTLVRDFVPCYRKADNVAGLYDLVNDTFHTNAGSGTFDVGDDVSGGSSDETLEFTYSGNYTDNRTNGKGTVRLNTSGTLNVISGIATVVAYILAGGGGAHKRYDSDGYTLYSGGGGGNQTVMVKLSPGTYEIVIGTGGEGSVDASGSGSSTGYSGGTTTAFGYTSTGGGSKNRKGGTPNGGDGELQSYGSNLAGGSPNGGAIVSGSPKAGGDGYVELTFI